MALPPHPRGVKRAYTCCGAVHGGRCLFVVLWQMYTLHLLISGHDRRTEPKFGTHVRIDTLTLKKFFFDPPQPRGGLGGYILFKMLHSKV